MKETKKNNNNNAHLYGYINGVRMNDFERDGKKMTAINLDVVTMETYKVDGNFQNKRTYHDVVLFTDDQKLIKSLAAIATDVTANRENRDVEGFKPKTHTISVDGILVNKENSIKGSDKAYTTLQFVASEPSIDLDVKQADKEVRNRAELSGNIAKVNIYEEQGFATANLVHHYRPDGAEKEFETSIQIRVDGNRKFSKETYEALKKGEMGVGDFIRVGGQLHNNNYENEQGKRYGMALDVTSSELLHKKGEKQEVKAEKKPAKKAEEKAAKKAEPKKATPRKKGVKIG